MASFTRRGLLVSTARVSAAGLAVPLLAACGLAGPRPSTAPAPASGVASSAKAKVPSYAPIQGGPAVDLPARADGVDAGYYSFPQTLFKSVKEAPGKGEDVSLMTNVIQGAVVPLEQNAAWQAVN